MGIGIALTGNYIKEVTSLQVIKKALIRNGNFLIRANKNTNLFIL